MERCSSILFHILHYKTGKSFLILLCSKLTITTGVYELLKITWTEISVRPRELYFHQATLKLCSHKQNHGAQYRICWNALGCRFPEWSTNLRCATSSVRLTSTSIKNTKLFKSGLFQFILPSVLLCKITHKKGNRFLSIMSFFLLSFCFTFCNNSGQLRKRNGWEACGQQR